MKKILFIAALLAAGTAPVQAANIWWLYSYPEKSAVTITFSGYCSGKITDTVDWVYVKALDDPMSENSYVRSYTNTLDIQTTDYFDESYPAGAASSISIKKGVLSIALNNSSTYALEENLWKIHDSGRTSGVTCKDGQTLQTILNDLEWDTYFVWDKTLAHKTSFVLKGKAEPFDYKYASTTSGYLELPTVCKNTGAFTGNIATDTFSSTCKMVNKVKVQMSITASGDMYYD